MRTFSISGLCIALLGWVTVAWAAPPFVAQDKGRLVDAIGRERIHHGLNVVKKSFPWLPDATPGSFDPKNSFSNVDMSILQSYGMNSVRLGLMWPGVVPEARGQVNTSYLATAWSVVTQAAGYGMDVLLDAHQDLLAAQFCGEGAPTWAVLPTLPQGDKGFPFPLASPYELDADGIPSGSDCSKFSWGDYQFAYADSAAYQQLYTNETGMKGAFAEFWNSTVAYFRGVDGVLGIEILNEPWAGNLFDAPGRIVPSVADRKLLQPFYDYLSPVIRAADPDRLVFFESVTFDDMVPVGFEHPPGGEEFGNLSVLSYHYYDPPNIEGIKWHFDQRQLDADRLGCGRFLTEFDTGVANVRFRNTTEEADRRVVSWQGWEYKPFTPITGWGWGPFSSDGTRRDDVVADLARTYAQRVPGHIVKTFFDADSKAYDLEFAPCHYPGSCSLAHNGSRTADIYANIDLHYPSGFEVVVTPQDAATVAVERFMDPAAILPASARSDPKLVALPTRYAMIHVTLTDKYAHKGWDNKVHVSVTAKPAAAGADVGEPAA